jgi:uncharacterized protein (DUF697 family)
VHDDIEEADYEHQQLQDIRAWKARSPSIVSKIVRHAFKPVAWAIGKAIPASAVDGGLRGADWAVRLTLSEERVFREAGVLSFQELKALELRALDGLARSFHRHAVGYAVVEGGATGAAGLPGIAADIPAVIAIALRTIRGIGTCYGYPAESDGEREFAFGILSAAGANSLEEKASALLFLRELQVTVLNQSFKTIGEKAAGHSLSREAAIITIRKLARKLGVNLTKRKMLQVIPVAGAMIGAAVNGVFIDDVAWAARRSYQERWLRDRGPVAE